MSSRRGGDRAIELLWDSRLLPTRREWSVARARLAQFCENSAIRGAFGLAGRGKSLPSRIRRDQRDCVVGSALR